MEMAHHEIYGVIISLISKDIRYTEELHLHEVNAPGKRLLQENEFFSSFVAAYRREGVLRQHHLDQTRWNLAVETRVIQVSYTQSLSSVAYTSGI